ncbi:hypothetical protein LY78DRAFT_292636 [Colletotrichum sublineola]|nr:hypothetical protein LY78DRAFT_292636 [Colletotrichum sublineola]
MTVAFTHLCRATIIVSGCRASTDSGGADPGHVPRHVTHLDGSFNIYSTIAS